jgi:PadR family transcriptional regulator, regulatory protein PadR
MPDPELVNASPAGSVGRLALRPDKELLIAWSLLLLDGDMLYGYRLHQGLRARGMELQATSLYRRLRTFEQDGWVASSWSAAVDGPPRRVYRLTADGREALRDISRWLAAMRDACSTFLDDHQRTVAERVDGAGERVSSAAPAPRRSPTPTPDAVARMAALQPLRPHQELLAGSLLLALEAGATYGYDLRWRFAARGLSVDGSAVYRMLRRLEADKWVQSRWLSPAAGPRRRFYRLTTRGRRNLDEIAVLIGAIRDSHDSYLREHAHATRSQDALSDVSDRSAAA